MRSIAFSAALAVLALSTPTIAQDTDAPPQAEANDVTSVNEGDFLTVGIGAAFVPSYDGSDDYTVTVLPLVQGRIGGIGISPRPGGLALDLIDDGDSDGPHLSLGPAFRIRANRDGDVDDEVVELLPDLDTAWEVGASAGISFPAVLNPYDSFSISSDVRWDVAGAHDGMVISPGISYSTPLSEGIAAILGVSAEYADDAFMDYYYSIDAGEAAITGLPQFQAEGGFRSIGTQLLVGFDLNGDLRDGGLALFGLVGYSRLLGDAADTPFTAQRGSADQFMAGAGLAYTF